MKESLPQNFCKIRARNEAQDTVHSTRNEGATNPGGQEGCNELRALNEAAANEFIKRVLHNFIVN